MNGPLAPGTEDNAFSADTVEDGPSTAMMHTEHGPAARALAAELLGSRHSRGSSQHHDGALGTVIALDAGGDDPRPQSRLPAPTMPRALDPAGSRSLREALGESVEAAKTLAAQNRVLRAALDSAHEARAAASAARADSEARFKVLTDEVTAAGTSSIAAEKAAQSAAATASTDTAALKQQIEEQACQLAAVMLKTETATSAAEGAKAEASAAAAQKLQLIRAQAEEAKEKLRQQAHVDQEIAMTMQARLNHHPRPPPQR